MPISLYVMLGGVLAIIVTIGILDSVGRRKSRR